MSGLTERERRLIALAILVGLIAAAWLLVVSPVLAGFSTRREARAAAAEELTRDARLIADFGAVRGRLAALHQAGGVYAITAPSAAVAAEAARARVAAAVGAAGGLLQAVREQPAARGLRLQADMRIGLADLIGLLRRLEQDRPCAAIEGLSIAAPEATGSDGAAPLEVRLELTYGYAQRT